MSRSEKEIKDRKVIDAVIRSCQVCRLGLCDDGEPYVVPLCFGYDGEALYFHGAPEGRKISIIRKNKRVCFEFDVVKQMVEAEQACRWTIKYQSVIGFGRVEILENQEEKRRGLAAIMSQYSEKGFTFSEEVLRRTLVIRVKIERVTGKQSDD